MIELSIADDVAEIVLNAPKRRNAVDAEALKELADAYARAEDSGVRALLLRGEGAAFCAGRDISGVDPATDDALSRTGPASASGWGCWWPPTSSTLRSRRRSEARSPPSARRSIPVVTRCSTSGWARIGRST